MVSLKKKATDRLILNESQINEQVSSLRGEIERSYAHNSGAYDFFSKGADLTTIVEFLNWDSAQPPFFTYLNYWADLVPREIRPALEAHIAVEVGEGHSSLFKDMLEYLHGLTQTSSEIDESQLTALNYTFSQASSMRDNFGFFLGGFFATEIMSAKRCRQLFNGLVRLGVRIEKLSYLSIHFEADTAHSQEVADLLIKPALQNELIDLESIQIGARDRLNRSEAYLRWYEKNRLNLVESI